METEDRERLVRVETKVDQIMELMPLVRDHETSIGFVKKIIGFLGSAVIAVIGAISVVVFKKHGG